jgi:hypothetical protein
MGASLKAPRDLVPGSSYEDLDTSLDDGPNEGRTPSAQMHP